MTVEQTASTPSDRATGDPALGVPTNITAPPVTAPPVTVGEIAEFLRHLTDLRTSGSDGDPDARATFLHRKAELFTRLAADPAILTSPPAPGKSTP
jgi:hypothetical protein